MLACPTHITCFLCERALTRNFQPGACTLLLDKNYAFSLISLRSARHSTLMPIVPACMPTNRCSIIHVLSVSL